MRAHDQKVGKYIECNECKPIMDPVEGIWNISRVIMIIASTLSLSIGLILEFILKMGILALSMFLITSILSGYKIVREGVEELLRGSMSIDLLVTIAAAGAFLIGHGEEGATVLLLFYIAESLEEYATERARRSIKSLMELAPEVATIRKDGQEMTVPIDKIEVGDVIVVRPGEKIPLDGIVIRGSSTVNQAPITGESTPVSKTVGDEVYAGTINNEGFLEVKITKRPNETMLAKIVRLVEEAQRRKSRTEKFIDRFSKYYTPLIILLAILVVTIPTLLFKMPYTTWMYRALILLTVSCPCALAISTPIALVSGITSAARKGVLIKGGFYVEEIGKVRVFAFDKTGTLTKGELEVTDVIPLSISERELLLITASLENPSEHPIARAIIRYAHDRMGIKPLSTEGFKAIPGKGVKGIINGKTYYAGSVKLFEELGFQIPSVVRVLERMGRTIILIGDGEELLGIIGLMDKIRDDAFITVKWLKNHGIKTVMISGDNKSVAEIIAKKLGVDEFYAELLPHEKVMIIEKLTKSHRHVAMVGDGVNDAPALAKASVGIAMGVIGSDVALETADIALMEDDLSKIPYLIRLSKKTLEIVKENIVASILVKGSLAILASFGMITLWAAVAIGDMGLSLAVILNALRIPHLKT